MFEAAPRQVVVRNEAGVDEDTFSLAKEGLRLLFLRYGEDLTKNYAARYEFDLREVREYWGEKTFSWNVIPREADRREEKSYRSVHHHMRAPKERVVSEIPWNPSWAYRGMSWEEWRNIRKSGFIQSRGTYNLGDSQKGLTIFADDPGSATHYSAGFAPMGFTPGKRRPGVVIAIDKDLTMPSNEHLWGTEVSPKVLIPQGERALQGRLPIDHIRAVWLIVPSEVVGGRMELVIDRRGKWSQGSSSGVSLYGQSILQVYPKEMLT